MANKVFNIGDVGKCGAAKARNYGAKQAEGDVILFIDADTIAPKTWISKYVSVFENTNYKALSGILYPIENEKTLINDLTMRIVNWILLRLLRHKYILGGNCGFKKDFFEKIGGFPESPFLEDIELALRIQKMGLSKYLINTKDVFVYTSLRKRKHLIEKVYWGMKYLKYYKKLKSVLSVNGHRPRLSTR